MALNESLVEAALNGNLAQCVFLILKKADVNWKNPDGVVLQYEASFEHIYLSRPYVQTSHTQSSV